MVVPSIESLPIGASRLRAIAKSDAVKPDTVLGAGWA
jgi:hypothetical protein